MRGLTGDGGYSDADSTFQGFKKKKKSSVSDGVN